MKAKIIFVYNEKGGTGKSTLAMQLVGLFLRNNLTVGVLDLDAGQKTVFRFFENRQKTKESENIPLPMPLIFPFKGEEDISSLPKYFKGLYLKVDPCNSENESIAFLVSNLYAEGAMITVYFDGDENGTSYQDFILGPMRFTQVIRDRSRSMDPLYKNQMENPGDTADGGQRLYIEGSGGSRVRFRIPDFPTEIDGDKVVINQAVLVLKNVDKGKESDIGYPAQLQGFLYYGKAMESDLPDASNPGGYYDEDAGEYRLNVTRYYQKLVYLTTLDTANRTNFLGYVDVAPISEDRYEEPTRVVLYGPRAEKNYMRLEVIYTVINDSVN